jgi:hypothetical protein
MTNDQILRMTSDQILETFFGLFNWAYQIELPVSYRQQIEQHIRAGWSNNDPSEFQLVKFVLELSDRLNQVSDPDLHRLSIQQHFANEFGIVATVPPNQLNDKYRILGVMHTMIESLRPGATGRPIVANSLEASQAAQLHLQETLRNVANMRHEMLKAVAARLREEETNDQNQTESRPGKRKKRGK